MMIRCSRCGTHIAPESKSITWSVFSSKELICNQCARDESNHPSFVDAVKAMVAAQKIGNKKFQGIGVPKELYKKAKVL